MKIKKIDRWDINDKSENYLTRTGPYNEPYQMFIHWQPTWETICLLCKENIKIINQVEAFPSFFEYWNKSNTYRMRYQWNTSFIGHCRRQAEFRRREKVTEI